LNITIEHSQTEMGLVFHCRLWVLLFLRYSETNEQRGWYRKGTGQVRRNLPM